MKRVVIATSTLYKDVNDVRAQLALRFASLAEGASWPMTVVDAGSPKEFVDAMYERGAHVLLAPLSMKMGACRRQAMDYALAFAGDEGVVIWSEPEKHPLICDIGKIADPILSGRVDMVVPQRSEAGMASYPPEQADAERIGNRAFQYLTGMALDVWFGVFAANAKALRYFLEYNGEYGDLWDSIIVPRVTAIKDGVCVASVPVSYTHPPEQTSQETGNVGFLLKRLAQLQNLVPSLQKEAAKKAVVQQ